MLYIQRPRSIGSHYSPDEKIQASIPQNPSKSKLWPKAAEKSLLPTQPIPPGCNTSPSRTPFQHVSIFKASWKRATSQHAPKRFVGINDKSMAAISMCWPVSWSPCTESVWDQPEIWLRKLPVILQKSVISLTAHSSWRSVAKCIPLSR